MRTINTQPEAGKSSFPQKFHYNLPLKALTVPLATRQGTKISYKSKKSRKNAYGKQVSLRSQSLGHGYHHSSGHRYFLLDYFIW